MGSSKDSLRDNTRTAGGVNGDDDDWTMDDGGGRGGGQFFCMLGTDRDAAVVVKQFQDSLFTALQMAASLAIASGRTRERPPEVA